MFFTIDKEDPVYKDIVEIDLSEIEANLSGPKRPQDLIPLSQMQKVFQRSICNAPEGNQGFGLEPAEITKEVTVKFDNGEEANNENRCGRDCSYHKLYKYI